MKVEYTERITETEIELRKLEKENRSKKVLPRLQMLRFFKSGKAKTQPECAKMLGFSLTQIERWWRWYRQGGLSKLLDIQKPQGHVSKLTPQAYEALEEKMIAGEIPHLRDVQVYLKDNFGIEYSLAGVWYELKKHRVKLKTPRPRHRKAEPQAQSDFKKKFPA
jgi:putative transposase